MSNESKNDEKSLEAAAKSSSNHLPDSELEKVTGGTKVVDKSSPILVNACDKRPPDQK
jgi:hypothetical protein